MISHLLKIITFILALVPAAAIAQNAPQLTVKSKSDSTTLTMGDRVNVNVEVIKDTHEGALVNMPQKEKDYHGMEMVDCVIDSTDLGNGRTQLIYHFTFQAFDPAELLTLPGFSYAIGTDTVTSDILTFKVLPVELSPELGDPNDVENLKIHPDELVVTIPSKWYDFIPDWWIWVLVAFAIIGLGVAVYFLLKKHGDTIFTSKKPMPPFELAIFNLKKLKEKHLIENGLAKQFYTEVTDIWRTYLAGRFGINAMEMTSKQILRQLRENKETHLSAAQMENMLQLSDFVKFAAMNPTRDEMVRAYDTIYDFVESTRPSQEPDEDSKTTDNIKEKK